MILPLAGGFALAWAFLPETPLRFAQALLVGVALSISAVPVAVKVLTEMRLRMPPRDPAPLRIVEREIEPWVSFVVIPLFAFFNSGVPVEIGTIARLLQPESNGIVLGLVAGKPVGILVSTWVAVRLGVGRLPPGVTWKQVSGVAVVAGIGFTMSLFIAALAIPDPRMLASAKLAVLVASLIAAAAGIVVLHLATRPATGTAEGSAGRVMATTGLRGVVLSRWHERGRVRLRNWPRGANGVYASSLPPSSSSTPSRQTPAPCGRAPCCGNCTTWIARSAAG